MKINFRVVGIFCKLEDFDIGEFVTPPTVRDAMAVIRATPGSNFTFAADDELDPSIPLEKASLLSASYLIDTPFTSPTGNKYPPGAYTLADNIDTTLGVAHVFQYYIMRPLGAPNQFERISTGGNKFIPFGKSEALQDGDTVIWRQVSIKLPVSLMRSSSQFKRLESLGAC